MDRPRRQEFNFHLKPQTTEDEFNDFLASIPIPSELVSAKDAEAYGSDLMEQSIDIFTAKSDCDEQLVKTLFSGLIQSESNIQNTKRPRLKTEQMDEIARLAGIMSGKFLLLYLSKENVDSVFFKMIQLLADGVGTRVKAFKRSSRQYAITFSTMNFDDKDDLKRCADALSAIFDNKVKFYYKTDLYSLLHLDSTSAPRYGLQASRFMVEGTKEESDVSSEFED